MRTFREHGWRAVPLRVFAVLAFVFSVAVYGFVPRNGVRVFDRGPEHDHERLSMADLLPDSLATVTDSGTVVDSTGGP